MLTALLATALLAAAPAPASTPEPVRLAAPGFTAIRLSSELGGFYTEHLAQGLTRAGLQVVTAREIQALIGLERQKQLLGCSDEASSCMAELAGALGVDGMVLGDVARVGRVYQLNVKVLPAAGGAQLAGYSARVESEEALLEALDAAATALAHDVLAKLRPAPGAPVAAAVPAAPATALDAAPTSDVPVQAARSSLRSWAWAPAAAGGVLGLGGALYLMKARSSHARLTDASAAPLSAAQAERERASGERAQLLSRAGLGLGVLGLITSGVFYALGTPPPPGPQVMGVRVLPTGLSLQGTLP